MKHVLQITTLIGLLFIAPNSLAKTPKIKRTTIKYENGDRYVGEIKKVPKDYVEFALIQKLFIGNEKLKHGKGILYYANGDQLNGEWRSDKCVRGVYRFTNGDILEGAITYHEDATYYQGSATFANEGSIVLGYKTWYYPDNCCFIGTIKNKKPYTGSFDCTLTTRDGDRFSGKISHGHIESGEIEYANGDRFEGKFRSNKPASGKYRYGSITNIIKMNHRWTLPAGCTFDGDLSSFSGTVDMKITNNVGDQFIGQLQNGAPDEGTMIYAATGRSETGKWRDGLSPSEYLIRERQKDSIARAQAIIQKKKELESFEKYVQSRLDDSYSITPDTNKRLFSGAVTKISQLFIGKSVRWQDGIYTCQDIQFDKDKGLMVIKCTSKDGEKVLYSRRIKWTNNPSYWNTDDDTFNYPKELTDTYYACDAYSSTMYAFPTSPLWLVSDRDRAYRTAQNHYVRLYGSKYGNAVLNRKIELGMSVEMVQAIKGKGEIQHYVSDNKRITVLSYGGFQNALIAAVITPVNTYTFVNGKLTEYTSNEGQGSVIWY